MFSKHKNKPALDLEQHEQIEYAQNRIRQKKNLYRHFVWLLIGSVVLVILNKVLLYGEVYDWAYWTIALWLFFFLVHIVNVFILNEFMGRDWERQQREKLLKKQKERIAALQKEVEATNPAPQPLKKKRNLKTITMIAAIAENNALGKDNALLWHLPDDFKRFKAITTGHTIIMGRKTFESFPRPLPKRHHIIITRDRSYTTTYPECTIVHSLSKALQLVGSESRALLLEVVRSILKPCRTLMN